MRIIVAALGLAVLAASASVASAAPSTPFVAGVGPALAAPAAVAVQPAGVEVASRYGYGYGRPHYGRPHVRPYPHRPAYGWHPRPRTRVVQRPCSTRVVERRPWGRSVTVYQHCGRRW